MKTRHSILAVFLLLGILSLQGQTKSTKATKIILVVNKKSDAVEHIELLANFQKMNQKERTIKYAEHKFFMGVLKGTYHLDKQKIIPGYNTTIVIYTEKEFAPSKQFFQDDDLLPGDKFNLGKTKAKVITNKKGELTIKTEK